MNNLSGDTVTLSELVRTEEHGLNVNRLLFAKFLVMTGRIGEGHRADTRVETETSPTDEALGDEAPVPSVSAVGE